jgi:hypothetical protein
MISFEDPDAIRIRPRHECLCTVIQPVLLDLQTFGDPRCGVPNLNCRNEDGIDVDRCPSGVVGECHRCSADHEHFPSDSNCTQLFVQGSQCCE